MTIQVDYDVVLGEWKDHRSNLNPCCVLFSSRRFKIIQRFPALYLLHKMARIALTFDFNVRYCYRYWTMYHKVPSFCRSLSSMFAQCQDQILSPNWIDFCFDRYLASYTLIYPRCITWKCGGGSFSLTSVLVEQVINLFLTMTKSTSLSSLTFVQKSQEN